MRPWLKKTLVGVGGLVGTIAVGGGGFVWTKTSAYAASMTRVYDSPPPAMVASSDPEVIARGKHLVESLGACASADCHGADLSGGKTLEMGPLGTLTGPNITPAGIPLAYSDGELGRLLTRGLKKDGTSVTFMPVQEFGWLPDEDIVAIISYVRSVPPVEKPNGVMAIGVLGKFLDRQDSIVLDVARRIALAPREQPPAPAPTPEYGRFVARLCTGCHGETFSGGRIPGTPDSIPVPANITPHETGIGAWTYEDFERLLDTGVKKNGEKVDPFMPIEGIARANETERRALWEYLRTVPPKAFGGR